MLAVVFVVMRLLLLMFLNLVAFALSGLRLRYEQRRGSGDYRQN